MKNIKVVVLAAGKGTRMYSDIPKVMHNIAGRALIEHILFAVAEAGLTDFNIVSSDDLLANSDFATIKEIYNAKTFLQKERLGTAHALLAGLGKLENVEDPVLVVCGDTPLLTSKAILKLIKKFEENEQGITCVTFKAANPHGYGRIISEEEFVLDIVEEKDATDAQRKIDLCNASIYLFSPKVVKEIISKIENKNASSEYYLTDAIRLSNQHGITCNYICIDEAEVQGVNDKMQLAKAENIMQDRLRKNAMLHGVHLLDPNTVYLSANCSIARGVVIHQNVVIAKNVVLEKDVEILPFSHLEDCTVQARAKVGPFARIRPKTEIGEDCKVGNFVEIKASTLGAGSKASHLTYIGDAKIGSGVNIGAGTIFCNYDGYSKHETSIGNDVFIGSNSSLIAPVTIADNAIVGAGSTITEDVNENCLSIARARQVNYQQKADLIRAKNNNRNS